MGWLSMRLNQYVWQVFRSSLSPAIGRDGYRQKSPTLRGWSWLAVLALQNVFDHLHCFRPSIFPLGLWGHDLGPDPLPTAKTPIRFAVNDDDLWAICMAVPLMPIRSYPRGTLAANDQKNKTQNKRPRHGPGMQEAAKTLSRLIVLESKTGYSGLCW